MNILILETAINIGYSCKLLTDEMEEMFVIDGETYADVEGQLKKVFLYEHKTVKVFKLIFFIALVKSW